MDLQLSQAVCCDSVSDNIGCRDGSLTQYSNAIKYSPFLLLSSDSSSGQQRAALDRMPYEAAWTLYCLSAAGDESSTRATRPSSDLSLGTCQHFSAITTQPVALIMFNHLHGSYIMTDIINLFTKIIFTWACTVHSLTTLTSIFQPLKGKQLIHLDDWLITYQSCMASFGEVSHSEASKEDS